MQLSLRQLSVFEAIVRVGKLTLAAQQLAMSQSAASQALKELESALGYGLFQRVGRDLVITDAGLRILPKVRQLLQLSQELQQGPQLEMGGRLKVAASVTIASYILPHLLADFMADYPNVELDILIGNTKEVVTALEKGLVQVGLIEGPALHNQLHIVPWRTDQLQLFCYAEHPLAQQGRIQLSQLADYRWILREQGSGTRAIFDAALQQAGAQLHQVLALSRQEAIKQAVKAGLGLGCLSRLSIAEEVAAGSLVVLDSDLTLTRHLSLVAYPSAQNSYLVNQFIDYVQEQGGFGDSKT